tara:strand:+ start:346 stop:519 length:174 start_codon:yes stop_codon:yes gene_type:complete
MNIDIPLAQMLAKLNESFALRSLHNGSISQKTFDKKFTYKKILLRLLQQQKGKLNEI